MGMGDYFFLQRTESMKTDTVSVGRQSNIELLRIVAMVMIVASHFAIHGGFKYGDEISLNSVWITFFGSGGKLGVDIFLLISGYFSVMSKRFRYSRVIRLWLQGFFYAVGIYLVLILTKAIKFKTVDFLLNFIPVSAQIWWFLTCFFIITLLSPLLNRMVRSLSQSTFKKALAVMTVFWILMYTVLNLNGFANELVSMFYMYSIGAYIRLWRDEKKNRPVVCILSAIVIMLLSCGLTIGMKQIVTEDYKRFVANYFGSTSLFVAAAAVLLFIGFKNIRMGEIKWLNAIAAATFGVYLIHEDPYMRGVLWSRIFKTSSHAHSSDLIFFSLWVTAAVFAACIVIELLRIHLIERWYLKPLRKQDDKISAFVERVCQKILRY